jgi:hypothetical protein
MAGNVVDFDKVGLLAVRGGKVLLCRKKHTTSLLIFPGGCREAGESTMDCLNRELREELGEVSITAAELVGVYRDRAAGPETGQPKTDRALPGRNNWGTSGELGDRRAGLVRRGGRLSAARSQYCSSDSAGFGGSRNSSLEPG